MHILIAPNAFKNSLTATEAAACIQQGLQESMFDCTSTCFPIGDGGDGTGELIVKRFGGQTIEGVFSDPLGRKIRASFGFIDAGKTAVIEMADASGLNLLNKNELDPLRATSRGTGEMIKQALDLGAGKIIITLGGSATVDGGCGILYALGVRFLDRQGNELLPFPESLSAMVRIDTSGLDVRVNETSIEAWCDVDNRLLGLTGAAAMFGPQKGASEEGVKQLEKFLHKLNEITIDSTGQNMSTRKFGGAAGGTAAFLHAFLQAKLMNGIDRFLEISDFEKALEATDLVITGEGQIDLQTLQGKGPYGVAMMAKKKNIPVIAVAGKIPSTYHKEFSDLFDVLIPISHQSLSLDDSIRLAAPNLTRAAREIGHLLHSKGHIDGRTWV